MIVNFIVALLMVLNVFSIWKYWSESETKTSIFKNVLFIFITALLTLFNYFIVNDVYKIFTMSILLFIVYKFLYKVKLKESVAAPLLVLILYSVSETIFVSIMLFIFKNNIEQIINNYFGAVITNMCISFLVFLLARFKLIKKLYKSINNLFSKMDDITTIFLGTSIVYIYSIFSFVVYYNLSPSILLLMSSFITILSFTLVYLFTRAKYDYYKISNNYNNSLLSLKELENAITNHRIDNHENRNHLMTIRNMTSNKKVISFIDSILNNKLEDDKRIMKETSIIPAGGLRGLIYSKLLIMHRKDIEYELDVSNSVRVVDLLEYDDSLMLDVCKIIGIFLDNAIEEVETIDDKYIVVEMYVDNDNLNISITNAYNNTIDKTNIYKAGYSTKGGKHGYGLSLVKKIVKNNDKLENYNEITENEFVQKLVIKK